MIRLAIALLAVAAAFASDYNRKDYGRWIDADKDCQNTRHEVLIAYSQTPAKLDGKGCKVIAGKWLGPYTGKVFTDPSKIDIDHVVPLKEAHGSGAASWSRQKKRAFANDPDNLLPVSARANRQKGAKTPVQWMPAKGQCEYLDKWLAVKAKYGLAISPAVSAMQEGQC